MFKVLMVLAVFLSYGNTAKILGLFPAPSPSHVMLASALLKELANKGHNVTMVSPYLTPNRPDNYQDILLDGFQEKSQDLISRLTATENKFYNMVLGGYGFFKLINQEVLEHDNIQKLIQSKEKYDLVIQLWGFQAEPLLGIGHNLNATTIGLSVTGPNFMLNYLSGSSVPYSYVPQFFNTSTDKMSFLQRVFNTIINLACDFFYFIMSKFMVYVYNDFFPDGPPLPHLIENVDLVLVNSHYTTETPRPYLPNLIQIGGFYMEETKELSKELQKYLDCSKHGVIFFSFGTNIKSTNLPQEALDSLIKAFKNLKYDILWKFDNDSLAVSKNVNIRKWLPQKAILDHPNVKAFITHGGLGSTVESVYYGVPMICIPFFGDQNKNSHDSVSNGYALLLPSTEITEEKVVWMAKEIVENPKYKENVMGRSDLIRNRDINPMEKAIYWVEHAIKYKGAKHLKPKAQTLAWYQYMLIDVIAFLLALIYIVVCSIRYIFAKICHICSRKKCQNAKLKNS